MFIGSLDYGLSNELIALRDLAHQFASKEIKDLASEIDQKNEFPNQKKDFYNVELVISDSIWFKAKQIIL